MSLTEIKEDLRPYFDGKFESEEAFDSFCRIINDYVFNGKSYINIELVDVTTVIASADNVDIATVTGPKTEIQSMLDGMHKSIEAKYPGKTHATLLLYLQYDENANFTVKDTEGISAFISSSLDPDIDCIWGIGMDSTLGTDVRLTIVEGYKG